MKAKTCYFLLQVGGTPTMMTYNPHVKFGAYLTMYIVVISIFV